MSVSLCDAAGSNAWVGRNVASCRAAPVLCDTEVMCPGAQILIQRENSAGGLRCVCVPGTGLRVTRSGLNAPLDYIL